MSNWICDKCGATYIDVSHQEPSVLKQEIEIRQLKELLKECVEVLNDAQRNYGYDDSILDICSPIITKIDEVLK